MGWRRRSLWLRYRKNKVLGRGRAQVNLSLLGEGTNLTMRLRNLSVPLPRQVGFSPLLLKEPLPSWLSNNNNNENKSNLNLSVPEEAKTNPQPNLLSLALPVKRLLPLHPLPHDQNYHCVRLWKRRHEWQK